MITKKQQSTLIIIFTTLLFVAGTIVISLNLANRNLDSRVKADDLGAFCDNPPVCCSRIPASGDPHECDWPERKYCRPDQCAIPEGTPRERCGVAYVEDWPFGCVNKSGAGATATLNPSPTIAVTPTPVVTPTSAITPTDTPVPTPIVTTSIPPVIIYVTEEPVYIPPTITPPTPTPTKIAFKLDLEPVKKAVAASKSWWDNLLNLMKFYLP